MRSTAGLLTQWAEAAGPALVFALALALLASAPGAGELPPNADRMHHLEEAGAAAFPITGSNAAPGPDRSRGSGARAGRAGRSAARTRLCRTSRVVLERHQLRLLAEEPLAVLRDESPQYGGVVARKVLDMRGMAPGPAGEQPFLGQVLDELRAGGHLPLRQRAQDIGPHEALGRLQVGKAPRAIELRVDALVIARAIPALLQDAVGAALGHALGHELVRRRARRKAEADGSCWHWRSSWARCASRAGGSLFSFAVAAIGELVAKPAGAAGV